MKRLLPLLFLAFTASAQMPIDVEVGYRWLDLDGSEAVYRTQINEREGFLLRALTVQSTGTGFFDHIRIDASDLGTGPAGAFRIEAGKRDAWKLDLRFRQADAFNAHPGFALGQHTLDRTRTNFDLDLEFRPGSNFAPFLGVSSGRYEGPGTTTYALGQDEFLLDSDLDEQEREVRAGFAFSKGPFAGVVTQGWRELESDETLTLAPGAGGGNNPGSILGRPIEAGGITRNSEFDVSTPFTNAFVTMDGAHIKLIADFSRFNATGDGDELENATGSFVSFALSRYFGGLTDHISSRAENTTWRGGLRAELALTERVDVTASYRTEHRDLDGAAAFDTIFRNTLNFSGANPIDALEEVFTAKSALERDEDTIALSVLARQLGPFSLRGTFSRTQQDVSLSPGIEEIVVAGPEQGGDYDRTIDAIEAAGAFSKNGFTSSVSLRHESADDPIVRTDFLDRDRFRVRASYTFRRLVRVGITGERLDLDNDREGFAYDSDLTQYGADVDVAPSERFRVRAAYTRFDGDARMLIVHPESLVPETFFSSEDGDSIEGGFGFFVAPFSFDADVVRYRNEGSNPFDLDRYRARVTWDFFARAGLAAEWSQDEYDEARFPIANYGAKRLGLYLRWRQ